MMTSTFLDLGLSPAPNGLPGAPPAVVAGGVVPDFASALTDLMAGTAPAALVAGVPAIRQDLAVTGKMAPQVPGPKIRILADMPVCELLPPDVTPATGAPDITVTPTNLGDAADLAEPALEPALAWLLPPTKSPVSIKPGAATGDGGKDDATEPRPETAAMWAVPPVVIAVSSSPVAASSASVAATAAGASDIVHKVLAAGPGLVPTPAPPTAMDTAAVDTAFVPEPTPITKFAPQPRVRPTIADCEMPAPVADSSTTPAPLAAAPKPLESNNGPLQPIADASPPRPNAPVGAVPVTDTAAPVRANVRAMPPAAPDRVAIPVSPVTNAGIRPLADPLPAILVVDTPVMAPLTAPTVQPDILVADTLPVGEPGTAAAIKPAKPLPEAIRDPIAGMAETRLREAVAKRLEIQPVALPVRDSGATLAAAAAIRAAPAIATTLVESAAVTSPTSAPLDAGQLAPVAAGAPAAPPVGTAQQAGIDLTQDQGMHRMIDRIEHLRDAFDTRETRIRLIPDALGPVDISVRRDATSDSVQVHFTAAEAGTRQLIADAQQRLVEIADSRGVRIERATVDAGSSGAATTGQPWNGGDGQSRQQQQAQTAPQPRAPARAAREADPQSPDDRIA